ncbi:MAG: class II fumarate hydratase [Planctomycetaceae bacterium]|nr:class II fumarate hydratase [Planctomycetaceae bacterium]
MRIEHDTMGAVEVPDHAYYGAQSQRAVENFPISGKPMPSEFIHALGLVKWACAKANAVLGVFDRRPPNSGGLTQKQKDALLQACLEVADGKFDDQFPVDVFQTGSGTSTNMNANEVIARRANELITDNGKLIMKKGTDACPKDSDENHSPFKTIHPNDHVNCGQSTNDIFPTAIHVAVAMLVEKRLMPVLSKAGEVLYQKADDWKNIIKIGRTHLADATPMTLGQEFGSFASQLGEAFCITQSITEILKKYLAVGGTAVGSGINTHRNFADLVAAYISEYYGLEKGGDFEVTDNHFRANSQRCELTAAHNYLKMIAVILMNVANNIRWLGSGPRCGFYEIKMPDLQPGSSIMPGKVNPVLCEALMQVCAKVIGNDAAITACSMTGGQFQLNVMMPVMADLTIESVKILSNALEVFTEKCLKGLEANEEKCREGVEKSLMLATALAPHIGYEESAGIAKEAFKTGKTVRDVCLEQNVLPQKQLDEVLDPMKMCGLR